MIDLHTVADGFSELACYAEVWGSKKGERLLHRATPLYDPHEEADEWLAATDEAREGIRARVDARHALVVAERGRFVRTLKERKRSNAEASRAWRAENIEYVRAKAKEYRSSMTEAQKADEREGWRRRQPRYNAERKAHRLANPLPIKPKKSAEELRARKRMHDTAYQKRVQANPERRLARNVRERARYESLGAQEKSDLLLKKREARSCK